jgi:hypothetical protein
MDVDQEKVSDLPAKIEVFCFGLVSPLMPKVRLVVNSYCSMTNYQCKRPAEAMQLVFTSHLTALHFDWNTKNPLRVTPYPRVLQGYCDILRSGYVLMDSYWVPLSAGVIRHSVRHTCVSIKRHPRASLEVVTSILPSILIA